MIHLKSLWVLKELYIFLLINFLYISACAFPLLTIVRQYHSDESVFAYFMIYLILNTEFITYPLWVSFSL